MEDGMKRLSVVNANLSIIDYNKFDCGWCGVWEAPNPPVATVFVPPVVYLIKIM
jgi:hypothetical protein